MTFLLLACTPLAGTWSGEVDCLTHRMPVTVELFASSDRYTGPGEVDCSEYYGGTCTESFDLDVVPSAFAGPQSLDMEAQDCAVAATAGEGQTDCAIIADARWDGRDAIDGEWGECDFELERD